MSVGCYVLLFCVGGVGVGWVRLFVCEADAKKNGMEARHEEWKGDVCRDWFVFLCVYVLL